VLRANLKWKLVSQLVGSCLALMIVAIGITSCEQSTATTANSSMIAASNPALTSTDGPLLEVNTPASIARLAPSLEKYQPQIQILSPKPDEILSDDRVTVKLKVTDLPLFKQPELGLGNHLHVILDKQTYQGVYDLSQPLVFKNLAAGTHSLRVFASRPWHESFKNEGAYAQVTFNVLTKTGENNPDPQQPLLTYSRPAGTYGTEPIMLDYYLTNAPAHLVAQGSQDRLPDWRIRVTVNEQRFILDQWAPVYLQGFKQGKNWVRLELIDDRGNPIPNVYNDTTSIVTYDPRTKDALASLIRDEIDPNLARKLIDPDYVVTKPILSPSIVPTPVITSTPSPAPILPTPIVVITPLPVAKSSPSLSPVLVPAPIVITPPPIVKPSPNPVLVPAPIVIEPSPKPIVAPVPIVVSTPPPIVKSIPSPIVPNPIEKTIPSPVPESIAPQPIQPLISPVPASVPVVPNPAPAPAIERPVPVAKPSPVAIPTPDVVNSPIVPARDYPNNPSPQVLTSKPVPEYFPTPTVTPQITRVDTSPSPVITPIEPAAPIENKIENKDEKTWQTRSIELLNIARAKIRVFTNTIPAKAQRFGSNVRVWAGYAKDYATDRIQEWRNRG
jgi:hypothetical protein